ncbi:MAG: MBOAT family O-acyltransferase [Candidatus Paceibacterota bacterium]
MITVDFYLALAIKKAKQPSKKRIILLMSVVANTAALFFFKYTDFFISIHNSVFPWMALPFLNIALPIGLSFYTFQGISYLVDVYRSAVNPETSLKYFSLYKSAFPQLVAGPIERANHLLPQLKKKFVFSEVPYKEALLLIVVGLIKKVVIADNLAVVVNKIYGSYTDFNASTLAVAIVFFGFQIYCDFSGYVDIARGLGKLLGINFAINFNRPYFSAGISEFWHRWHISLSSWVRDYIYIPLGGNRKGARRQYLNLIAAMAVMGLWHGANWTFLIWGIYHGLLLVFDKLLRRLPFAAGVPKIIKIGITFCFINVGWIFFRSSSVAQSLAIIEKIFVFSSVGNLQYQPGMLLGFYLIFFLVAGEYLDEKYDIKKRIIQTNYFLFSIIIVMLIYILAFWGVRDSLSFIYFQF